MNEQMEFPETFEGFAEEYGFKDDKEIYTNGSDLIPIFRVKQWIEHDNKLRAIETDTAYECGRHEYRWIPVSERLPKKDGEYLLYGKIEDEEENYIFLGEYDACAEEFGIWQAQFDRYSLGCIGSEFYEYNSVIAWRPLPEPYKQQESEETE